MRKSLFALLSTLLVFSVVLAGCSEKKTEETKSHLEVVKKRGKLVGGLMLISLDLVM